MVLFVGTPYSHPMVTLTQSSEHMLNRIHTTMAPQWRTDAERTCPGLGWVRWGIIPEPLKVT